MIAVLAIARAVSSQAVQAPPRLTFAFELHVQVGAPVEMGDVPGGRRRIIPILGGTFAGPQIKGKVLPGGADWQIIRTDGLAVLDTRWAARMAPYPDVAGELTGRALDRSRRLATLMAISQQPRLDRRVWLLFWELADRHGTVHPDGVHLRLRLTHEVISHLVAARRPSVSAALTRLAKRGVLRRDGGEWLLSGPPPDAA